MKFFGNAPIVFDLQFLFLFSLFYHFNYSNKKNIIAHRETANFPPPRKVCISLFLAPDDSQSSLFTSQCLKYRGFITQHWLMHTASMIATYAALNSVPDHQTNNALTDRLTAVRAAAHTAGRLKLYRA